MFRRLSLAFIVVMGMAAMPLAAQNPPCSTSQVLFATPDKYNVPYRIPAITTTRKGALIAVADRRYCGADIGYGRIDIVARISRDNGRTWGPDTVIQRGSGVEGAFDCGYGDAAIVADRTSNRVLCMSVTGNVAYIQGTRENPNRIARWYSPDGGKSWTQADDVTDAFYAMLPHTRTMFIGSGRLMQSRLVRKGRYYRVYCSVLTRTAMPDGRDVAANYVIYTDDFGATWSVLGGTTLDAADSPCVGGDEPKVEELPNGDVVLSSRKHWGRYFNIFHFNDFGHDQTDGWWDKCVASHDIPEGISVGGNSCNGEIFLVDAREAATGRAVKLMLQSLPFDDARAHVGIWYKEIKRNGWYSPAAFAHKWTRGLVVSQTGSAYSTMTMQKDGRIGFFYEEEPNYYNMVYVPLTISQITEGRYE